MEYWLVIIVNLIIGLAISYFNVIMAIPIVFMGLILGLILIIFKKIGGNDDV